MAQNECQQMGLQEFYTTLRNLCNNVYNTMTLLEKSSEFLESMDVDTAAAMGMDTTTRNVIADFRTAMNESLAFYEGTAQTQTKVLKTIVNQLRYM